MRRPLAVHDWDSVLYEPEVVIAGQAAAVFQDDRREGGADAGERQAFLEAYQSARGRAFGSAGLQLCWAAGLWVLAFNAKKASLDDLDVLGRAEAESRMVRGHGRTITPGADIRDLSGRSRAAG